MRRDEAAKLLPIIKAFSEGKEIQYKDSGNWYSAEDIAFFGGTQEFRIKPAPKYRPFKDAKECWNEMQKHQPFGWIKPIADSIPGKFMIINNIRINELSITSGIDFTYDELLKYYTFVDGTPFGIKEE